LEAAPEARTAEVWSDVEGGRFDDIDDGDLDHFIGELGLRAAQAKPTRLMADYRLSHAAQADKVSILGWSNEQAMDPQRHLPAGPTWE